MGVQRLNARSTRRLARLTGLDIVRAWTAGSNTRRTFITADRQQGWADLRTGETGLYAAGDRMARLCTPTISDVEWERLLAMRARS